MTTSSSKPDGRAEVSIGASSFTATHRMVPVEEAMAVLAAYERRNRLVSPVVRLVLSRLLGWRYDGTDSARHSSPWLGLRS